MRNFMDRVYTRYELGKYDEAWEQWELISYTDARPFSRYKFVVVLMFSLGTQTIQSLRLRHLRNLLRQASPHCQDHQ